MNGFLTDSVVEEADLCNLEKDCETLLSLMEQGKNVIFAGRRNTGKTSLLKSKVIPRYLQAKQNRLAMFVDLMGVKSMRQVDHLMTLAFESAYAKAKPARSFLSKLMRMAARSRPSFSVDPLTNEFTFSFSSSDIRLDLSFQEVFKILAAYHKEYGATLIIDEFQDIATMPEAEARMREALQNLPAILPVVILGSKHHLLTSIFAKPKAPLANWGRYLEISRISAEDYTPYINARLKGSKLSFSLECTRFLLEQMEYIPECVNLVCDQMLRGNYDSVSEASIKTAIFAVIEERSSVYRHLLSYYSEKEQLFLRELSRAQPLATPYSVAFLARLRMSTGASRPLLRRLEDDGIILRQERGYQVSDPLLCEFLRRI